MARSLEESALRKSVEHGLNRGVGTVVTLRQRTSDVFDRALPDSPHRGHHLGLELSLEGRHVHLPESIGRTRLCLATPVLGGDDSSYVS